MTMTPAQRRKANAQRQREVRAERDRKKLCRECGKPAVISPRTKRLSRKCKRHLGTDADRKADSRIRPLGMSDVPAPLPRNGGSTEGTDRLLWWDQLG